MSSIVADNTGDDVARTAILAFTINATNSLTGQALGLLTNVSRQFDAGNMRPACNGLNAFINQVQAQAGKQLTVPDASELIVAAQEIRTALDCD